MGYKEVSLQAKEDTRDLKKLYQYEFAMYTAITELFWKIKCNTRCIKTLKLYYLELAKGNDENAKKGSQLSIYDEMTELVQRDVVGNIEFPNANVCMVETRSKVNPDGSHTFIFTDSIYEFSARFDKKNWKIIVNA
jgi:hypothetical protein